MTDEPRRGTGWVVSQFVVMAIAVAAGFVSPHWPEGGRGVRLSIAGALVVAGVLFAVWAGRALGRSLTPFPRPVVAGLVTRGPFAVVRHPIYTGGLLLFVGYSLFTSVSALVVTAALAILWGGKLRLEERLLAVAYDEYGEYCRVVRWRLLPFVY